MAMELYDLDQKTFVAESPEEMDKLCNEFKKEKTVRFSQVNTPYDFHKKKVIYISTLFYFPEGKDMPTVTSEQKQKVADENKEEKWCTCTQCNVRMKYSHFQKCKNQHGIEGVPEENKEEYKKIWGIA